MALHMILFTLLGVVQAGQYQAVCPDEKIEAVEDSEVILPCHVEPWKNLEEFLLGWRSGSEVAYAFRHRQEDHRLQAPQFRGRMRVELEGLKTGDLSLKISSVQLSDQGTYRCSIIEPGSSRTSCIVELVVGEHRAVCPDEKIKAVNGSEAILPCHVEPRKNLEKFLLNWRSDSEMAYAYLEGQEDHRLQAPQFRGRTSVDLEGLKTGDLSLKISSVQLYDQGTYRCFVRPYPTCYVELVVEAQIHDRTPSTGTTGTAGSAAAGVVGVLVLVLVAGVAGLILILRRRQMINLRRCYR